MNHLDAQCRALVDELADVDVTFSTAACRDLIRRARKLSRVMAEETAERYRRARTAATEGADHA